MSDNLFSGFAPSGKSAWTDAAENELKRGISEMKPWKIDHFHVVEPYLTVEDLLKENGKLPVPLKTISGWLNMPIINIQKPDEIDSGIKLSLAGGAQGIILNFKNPDSLKCEFSTYSHLSEPNEIPVYFKSEQNPDLLYKLVLRETGNYLTGGIAHDPLAHWMRLGEDYIQPVQEIAELLTQSKDMLKFRPFMVESHVYHNAGATPVQELAFMTATMVGYADLLTDAGIAAGTIFNGFFFSVSIGMEYLTEIAKLRALRLLFQKISRAYQVPDEQCIAYIHARTSSFYDTQQLPHNNIVRSTCEAMSAVTGGCDALTVMPYNHIFEEPNDFSERIARNISLLLSEESYLNHVADPAAGSYFLEKLTNQLAEAAWTLFLHIEGKGGMMEYFKSGCVQNDINSSWEEKCAALENNRILVGVNKFRSEKDHENIVGLGSKRNDNELANPALLPHRNLALFRTT